MTKIFIGLGPGFNFQHSQEPENSQKVIQGQNGTRQLSGFESWHSLEDYHRATQEADVVNAKAGT